MAYHPTFARTTILVCGLLGAALVGIPPAPAAPGDCPIPAPEGFTVDETPMQNFLSWRPPALSELWGITEYWIYRTTDPDATPSEYDFLANVTADTFQYIDDQVEPFESYNYMITAVGVCGEGFPAFAPGQPKYPYCAPIVITTEERPGVEFRSYCLMPPPGEI